MVLSVLLKRAYTAVGYTSISNRIALTHPALITGFHPHLRVLSSPFVSIQSLYLLRRSAVAVHRPTLDRANR